MLSDLRYLTYTPHVISVSIILFTHCLSDAAHFNTSTPSESMARYAALNFRASATPFLSVEASEGPQWPLPAGVPMILRFR